MIQVLDSLCLFFGTIICKIFNCWISQNPWVKESAAVEEVIVCIDWPEVQACFEIQPRFTESFNAWIVFVDHASQGFWSPCENLVSCVFP